MSSLTDKIAEIEEEYGSVEKYYEKMKVVKSGNVNIKTDEIDILFDYNYSLKLLEIAYQALLPHKDADNVRDAISQFLNQNK